MYEKHYLLYRLLSKATNIRELYSPKYELFSPTIINIVKHSLFVAMNVRNVYLIYKLRGIRNGVFILTACNLKAQFSEGLGRN